MGKFIPEDKVLVKCEMWKDIEGYEGQYLISNIGNIHSLKAKRNLILLKNSSGYYRIILSNKGIKTRKFIHGLVASHFIGPSKGLFVNHIDGDKTNNIVDNLEYVTKSRNYWHAVELGNVKKFFGIDNPNSKRVGVYDFYGNKINEYESAGLAGLSLGISSSLICRAARGVKRSTGGYIFKYI